MLRGPDGRDVQVLCATRYPKEEREFTRIFTANSMLEVTSDHRVLTSVQDSVQDIDASQASPRFVVSGVGPQVVQKLIRHVRTSEVVDIILQDDEPVLVWTKRSRKPHLALADAFVVRGGVPSRMYDLVHIRHGFFDDVHVPPQRHTRRSRSLDAELSAHDRRRLGRARRSEWSCPALADHA